MTLKILMIGNLPDKDPRSLGGANTLTLNLYNSLKNSHFFDIEFLQIRTRWYRFGQLLDYVLHPFRVLPKIKSNQIISIHSTWDYHLTIGPFIVLLSKLFQKKITYHFFGGNFHKRYMSFPVVVKFFLNNTIFKSNVLFFETKEMVNYFESIGFKNIYWLPNSRHKPAYESDRVYKKRFVFISRVTRTKGVDDIISVFNNLPNDYSIDIYGPLDRKFYSSNSFFGNVKYRGIIKPSEVIEYLKQYDILLMPTFHPGEGYPGIFIEAMSLGKPIITTRWNALHELVDHDKSGILIPVRSTEALRNVILGLDQAKCTRLVQGSLSKFKQFDLEVIVEKLIVLYLNL